MARTGDRKPLLYTQHRMAELPAPLLRWMGSRLGKPRRSRSTPGAPEPASRARVYPGPTHFAVDATGQIPFVTLAILLPSPVSPLLPQSEHSGYSR